MEMWLEKTASHKAGNHKNRHYLSKFAKLFLSLRAFSDSQEMTLQSAAAELCSSFCVEQLQDWSPLLHLK